MHSLCSRCCLFVVIRLCVRFVQQKTHTDVFIHVYTFTYAYTYTYIYSLPLHLAQPSHTTGRQSLLGLSEFYI